MTKNPPIFQEPEEKIVLSHCDECGVSYYTTMDKRWDHMCEDCYSKGTVTLIVSREELALREHEDDMAIQQRDRDRDRCS